jgi:hypothetical protein
MTYRCGSATLSSLEVYSHIISNFHPGIGLGQTAHGGLSPGRPLPPFNKNMRGAFAGGGFDRFIAPLG